MTVSYAWVQWNAHKKRYDLLIALGAAAYLAVFMGVGIAAYPAPGEISPPVLLMRALGTLGIVLLHIILLIGPLARVSDLFAPLLYNRRHLGVCFFLIALLHALVAIGFYGGFGVRDPLTSVLAAPSSFASVSGFPFEVLGFVALLIFFVMAATSHDFWLANLGPRFWKSLHMLVYAAYGFVVLHVALGPLQSERHPAPAALLVLGVVLVAGVHLLAAIIELRRAGTDETGTEGWIDAGAIGDLADGAGCTINAPGGAGIALFRDGSSVHAVASTCAHQGGPLGEGRIIDGCVTCPWHGYQYRASDGTSPPPYTEKIPTHDVAITNGRVLIDPTPNAPGTPTGPARIDSEEARND